MLTRRPLLLVPLLACGAWLLSHALRVVVFGGVDLGPFSSRFAHDVVLVVAAGICLARGVFVARERAAWLLIGAGVTAWTLGEIYYTAVLWYDSSPPIPSPADAGYLLFPPLALAGMLVLRPPARAPAPRAPRRRHRRRARRLRAQRRDRLPGRAQARRRRAGGGGHQPRVSDRRPRPAGRRRRRAGRRPAGAWTAPGCCWPAASSCSGSPTRCTSSARPRASTSPAAGSTSAGGSGCC